MLPLFKKTTYLEIHRDDTLHKITVFASVNNEIISFLMQLKN